MRRAIFYTLLALSILTTGVSCRRNIYKADIKNVNVSLEVKRLEKDLFTINPARLRDSLSYLESRYDGFLKFFGYVINIGEAGDSSWIAGLTSFCTNKGNNELYQFTLGIFPDIKWIEKDVTEAFRRYHFFFPSKKIPAVYTCITGFNNSIIVGDSALGISLDKYLGPDNSFYRRLEVYRYQLAKMNPGNILPDCIYGWVSTEWSFSGTGYLQNNSLADMIHEGKILFIVKLMMPGIPDDRLFGFTPGQVKFCRDNEGRMWQYLVEHNLLFSSDMLIRKKLTGEAPFTTYFSSESPGRAAVWLGFRIVESYMEKNRDITPGMLMDEKDVQLILEKSRYRPSAGK
ncbi:MAG TPA: hypothetical protein VMT63_02295 [Bacteroidales bacterium]|nr:hypothetical protein [Bacteroidales bacterium]